MPSVEDRLIELELRYTHHQRFLDELSDVVARQQRDLDLLAAQLRDVRAGAVGAPAPVLSHDEQPPHY